MIGRRKGPRVPQSIAELLLQDWTDLETRLVQAAALLRHVGGNATEPSERIRLHAKAEGVLLALSYLRDYDGGFQK